MSTARGYKTIGVSALKDRFSQIVQDNRELRIGRPPFKNKLVEFEKFTELYEIKRSNAFDSFPSNKLSSYTVSIFETQKATEGEIDQKIGIASSYYIPTLRGLRPTQPNDSNSKTPYAERTIKDYFDPTKQKAENVITGENLYIELTQALLGEPKQRESVREYEQALSPVSYTHLTLPTKRIV